MTKREQAAMELLDRVADDLGQLLRDHGRQIDADDLRDMIFALRAEIAAEEAPARG